MPSEASPALAFRSLQKSYGSLQAVQDMTFSVPTGEVTALLGPNGAGKTTLIGCLGGVVRPDAGAIEVFGRGIAEHESWAKQTIGIVPQELSFDPFFTPLESLRQLRGLFGMSADEDYLLWLLEQLGLREKAHERSRGLSGGMKRRLMIAKALVHEPKILVLDEPTAGVDVELRQQLWSFTETLRREKGTTILLTTHYLEEAESLAQRTVIIRRGELIADAPTADLLSGQERIVRITLSDGTTHEHSVQKGETMGRYLRQYTGIMDVSIQEPRLEDVFLELTH